MALFASKTALISGGSDGIGFAIAAAFAEQGANLVIVGRDEKKLSRKVDLLKQYGVEVLSIPADMACRDSLSEIPDLVRSADLRVNILVNNAGIGRFEPFPEMTDTMVDYHLDLNVKAPYVLTRLFLDDLVEFRGNVVNISSYFAKRMLPDRPSAAYSMTKGALESFTKALAYELGPAGVRVNAIAPGTVNTPQVQANLDRLAPDARERFHSMIQTIYPLQTIGEPSDVANMAVFLASDKAKWITGGVFPVDGGLTTN